MGFVGTAGNAIIFMFAALGALLFLLYFLAYLAHCFLVTLDGTAAGADEVHWPDEPIYDWIWKFLFLGMLIALWSFLLLLPAALIAVLLDLSPVAFAATWLGLLWLIFPISLFSCLSSHRWTNLLHWPVLTGLLSNWLAFLWMYLVSAALMVGGAALVGVALAAQEFWFLLLAGVAPLVTALLLINARLLGRVAWLIGQKPFEAARRQQRRERNRPTHVQAHDPWAAEPEGEAIDLEPLDEEPAPPSSTTSEVEDEWAPPTAYGLEAASAKPMPMKPFVEKPVPLEERTGYDVNQETEPRMHAPVPLDGYRAIGADDPKPLRRRKRDQLPPPRLAKRRLRWPLVQGVFTFPWYSDTLAAWGKLSMLAFLHLVMLKTMLLWWPFGA